MVYVASTEAIHELKHLDVSQVPKGYLLEQTLSPNILFLLSTYISGEELFKMEILFQRSSETKYGRCA